MILVAGGTGLLGHDVVAQLLEAGEDVRVLTRDADAARRILGRDAQVAVGDVRQPETVREAVRGASVVISAVHGFLGGRGAGPQQIDVEGNAALAAAAAAEGAGMVLVSVLRASGESPIELFRAKWAAEQLVQESLSAWTIVRPSAYMETWIGVIRATAGKSGRPLIFGRGQQPIAFVSVADVARVVARAAVDETLRGQILEIAGPRCTMTELADAVRSADGGVNRPRHLPRGVLRATGVLARPFAPAFARQNVTALAMDTQDLGDADGDIRARLALAPATSLAAAVAQMTTQVTR